MKKLLLICCLSFITLPAICQEDIRGYWMAGEGKMIVKIDGEENGPLSGEIVWLEKSTNRKGEPITDRNNPDKSLRKRPIVGIDMLQNLNYENGQWVGKLYTPKKGRTVNAAVSLADSNMLDVAASFMGFSRDMQWYRTEEPR